MSTTHQVSTQWVNNMQFTTTVNGHVIKLDADSEFGGEDQGPRPKPLLLSALAGCTGMDVVSLLTKTRADFTSLSIDTTAELTDTHPKVYAKIHIIYRIHINPEHKEKMEKAVQRSQDQLCGVSNMLKHACAITWEIQYI